MYFYFYAPVRDRNSGVIKRVLFPQVIPPSSGLIDYAVSMRPDYHRAVIDTITHYGWKNVIYIYDSHDGETFKNY